MEIKNLLGVKNRAELREWLMNNHNVERECWINAKRGNPTDDTSLWYIDVVEEAICFGWIDSTLKKVSDDLTIQKLTPRKKKSSWTELNKERARRMEKLGMMTDSGRNVLPDMSIDSFVIDPIILDALKVDLEVYNNFLSFPSLYQRIRIYTIQVYKEFPEVFNSRLNKFIENTKKGIMYGAWDDNGRLSNY